MNQENKNLPVPIDSGELQSIKQNFTQACKRKSFAQKAHYSFPRGGKKIVGESVHLARVAVQNYQNIRHGIDVLRNDDDKVLIEAWCWDVENNLRVSAQDSFDKLIFRKSQGWIKPDERDLRELINRRGALLVRNCIFQVLPKDYIEDGSAICRETLSKGIKDPEGEKKRLLLEFRALGVTAEQVNRYVNQDVWSPDDLVDLQGVLNALKEGAKREHYFKPKETPETETEEISIADMETGDSEKHQGYDPIERDDDSVEKAEKHLEATRQEILDLMNEAISKKFIKKYDYLPAITGAKDLETLDDIKSALMDHLDNEPTK